MANGIDLGETTATRARYNRIAPLYDFLETFAEHSFKPLREKLWAQARGEILEVGVGTGKNFAHHPDNAHIIGIDLADRMLARARARARELDVVVKLYEGDVQQLAFAANTFDSAVATCVFCSVPDPVRGLRELNRVVKPNGKILFIEHVRVDMPLIGRVMDLLNPLVVRLWGANINRRTIENIQRAGLCIEEVDHYGPMKMVKLIRARPNKIANG